MVATTLNAGSPTPLTQTLLSAHLHAFCDVDVIAAHVHFPAHRAVLAVHSLDFRHLFSTPAAPSPSLFPPAVHAHPSDGAPSAPPAPPASTPTPHAAASAAAAAAAAAAAVTAAGVRGGEAALPLDLRRGAAAAEAGAVKGGKFRVHIALDDAPDDVVLAGWRLVHAYIYGAEVVLTTDAVLAALPICRRYRFDELAAALDAYLCDGAVDLTNCTRVYAAAVAGGAGGGKGAGVGGGDRARAADAELVQAAAWGVMKARFAEVRGWAVVPYAALVRLLKLNDLDVQSEKVVFDAVEEWVHGNCAAADDEVVAGLAKLIRFPTMSQAELEAAAASSLVERFPVCRKYLSRGFAACADEKRGLVRSVVIESSPVYRRRRTDALTFSDRVTAWSRVDRSVHTSSRYFAGCLWNLVVEVGEDWVGLHLGCLSENDEQDVDVELDFSVFVVRHGGEEVPQLVAKEVKGACFGRSGQRIGFSRMLRRAEIEAEGARFLLRDTLFIGASLRLRCSKRDVVGISEGGDDTAESESRMA